MGFRCSLLGHDYGEPTTEEEREERGNEVVVTVRELEECSRCGTETVLSENTEVRSIDPVDTEPDDGESAPADHDSPESTDEGSESTDAGAGGVDDEFDSMQSAADDDAVILDDDGESRDDGEWPDGSTADESGDAGAGDSGSAADAPAGGDAASDDAAAAAESGDAEDDGGSVVDAEAAADEAADDPDLDRNGNGSAAGLAEWPDPGVDDEGYDARPSDDDDVDVEFGGGLQPESASGDAGEGAEYVSASGSGITSTGPVERSDDIDTVLVCPECEFDAESVSTSQRPGDICPECRRGYLTERGQ